MDNDLDTRPSAQGNDEDRLAELGYKQELTRNWSLLHNFGASFSIIVRFEPCSFFPPDICVTLSPTRLSGEPRREALED